jgi:adenylate cyclase
LRALRSDLINPAIAVHRGRVAKRTGDWAPRRISQRGRWVRCALEVQHAMVERSAHLL